MHAYLYRYGIRYCTYILHCKYYSTMHMHNSTCTCRTPMVKITWEILWDWHNERLPRWSMGLAALSTDNTSIIIICEGCLIEHTTPYYTGTVCRVISVHRLKISYAYSCMSLRFQRIQGCNGDDSCSCKTADSVICVCGDGLFERSWSQW